MKILFYFSLIILFCTYTLPHNSFGLSACRYSSISDYDGLSEDKNRSNSSVYLSGRGVVVAKEKMRTKRKKKNGWKNKIEKLFNPTEPDTDEKPDAFWTTVGLGLGFSILMLIFNVPLAALFFIAISWFGLGGYYIFRKKHKIIAEVFLMLATALNLGLGVFILYAISLSPS